MFFTDSDDSLLLKGNCSLIEFVCSNLAIRKTLLPIKSVKLLFPSHSSGQINIDCKSMILSFVL